MFKESTNSFEDGEEEQKSLKKTRVFLGKKSTEQPIYGVEELVCFLLTQCLELKRKLCFLEGTLCLSKPHFLKPHFLETHTHTTKKCSARTGGMLDCHVAHSFHGNSIHISIDFTNFHSSTSYSREQGSSLGAEESGEEEELTPNLETLI